MKSNTDTFIEEKVREFDNQWKDIRAGSPHFDWRILNKDIKDFFTQALSDAIKYGEEQTQKGLIDQIVQESANLEQYCHKGKHTYIGGMEIQHAIGEGVRKHRLAKLTTSEGEGKNFENLM